MREKGPYTWYNTIQLNTIQYNTIQYNTIQYNTIQYNIIQYNIELKFNILIIIEISVFPKDHSI